MNLYVTLTDLKRFLGDFDTPLTASAEDDNLLRFCIQASRVFDQYVTNGILPARKFFPTIETRHYDHPGSALSTTGRDSISRLLRTDRPGSDVLYLDQDLVEVTTLTTRNTGITIASGDQLLSQDGNHNIRPYDQIALDPNGTQTAFEYVNTPYKANAVTGWWCYHEDWDNAWQDTGDSVQTPTQLAAGATSLLVTDADGNDIYGLSNRFKIGGLYKFEDEMFWVTGINTSTEILTIVRGRNGSSDVAHANGTKIYEFKPMEAITYAMEILATRMYRRKDTATDDQPDAITPHGTLLRARNLPGEVIDALKFARKESL